MKILAFTDPHGEAKHADSIIQTSKHEEPAIVVCSGDFSFFGNRWRSFLEDLRGLGRKIHLVGGNHESDSLLRSLTSEYAFLQDVAYRTVEENGILIGGVPGYDSDFWPSKKRDQEIVGMAISLWGSRDRSKPFIFL